MATGAKAANKRIPLIFLELFDSILFIHVNSPASFYRVLRVFAGRASRLLSLYSSNQPQGILGTETDYTFLSKTT
jgi:hypothetical protein